MDDRPDPAAPAEPPAGGGEARSEATPPAGEQPAEPPADPAPTTRMPPPSSPPPLEPPPSAESGAGAGPPPGTPAEGRWHLRRSLRDRKLKGVAGGLAAAADIDSTLVRILFVVTALFGWGLVAYIVLAIVLQDETADDRARPLPRDQRWMLRIVLGVAAVLAAGRLLDGWFLRGREMGLPLVLIVAGAAVLWVRRGQGPSPSSPASAGVATGLGHVADPGSSPPPWSAHGPPPPLSPGDGWRSTGHDLLRLVAAFAAVAGFLALLGGAFLVAVGAVPMRLPFLPASVTVLGLLGLVIGVVRNVGPAVLIASGGVLVAAVALAVGLASFPGGAGDRIIAIGPETPLRERYEQSAGRLVLDLGRLSIEPGGERRVVAEVGAGQLTVMVPPSLSSRVTAQVGAGTAVLFGREQGGAGVTLTGSHVGDEAAGNLVLDLRVGVGRVRVDRPTEPTFDVTCQVPVQAKGDGTDPVTCPHPAPLARRQMACSVTLAHPGGHLAGKAFCRAGGSLVPLVGKYAAICTVPSDSDVASCNPLSLALQRDLAQLQASVTPQEPPLPGLPPLACGPPDPAGVRTCTEAPASSTTAAASTTTVAQRQYRCSEDPVTRQASCVPA